jgi:serine phosphatase RsbU (regulator of sigma subunit)
LSMLPGISYAQGVAALPGRPARLYSDGITEAMNAATRYGLARLTGAVRERPCFPPRRRCATSSNPRSLRRR